MSCVHSMSIAEHTPVAPVKPVDPVRPLSPVPPVLPVKPVEPVRPLDPVSPVRPAIQEDLRDNPSLHHAMACHTEAKGLALTDELRSFHEHC